MAWTHQFIDPTGRVKPCCRFAEKHRPKEHNLSKHNLIEIFNSNWMNNLRDNMIQGNKIDGCIRCYQEEQSGKLSLRQRYNQMQDLHPNNLIEDINEPKIRWIELAISNDCNLACRMCDSRYSWKWFNDELEMYGKTWSNDKKTKSDISKIESFLDNIVHVKFTGGEPLIIPDHYKILDKLSQSKNAEKMFLNYSTNLTIMPKQDIIDKWKKFKYIEIAASFDGTLDTWELIRYPSKWKDAEKVIQTFFSLTNEMDIRIGLRSTISVYNILNMPESFYWWIDNWNKHASTKFELNQWINPTHLTYPEHLSTTVLPTKYKDIVAEKLTKHIFNGKLKASIESQIKYMYSKDDSHLLKELKFYTLFLDSKRNQNFLLANPEFKGLFDGV